MQRKKILWLVSWYPNRNDPFDGDFIQRHAKAACIDHDVHVIFVGSTPLEKEKEEEFRYSTGLTEQLIYFREKKSWIGRITKQWTWGRLFQQAIEKYIQRNGLPHLIHVHVPWKAGLPALWAKRKFRMPFVVTEHWGLYNEAVEDNFWSRPRHEQMLLKKIFGQAAAFISESRFLAEGVKKVSGRNCDALIPNVVDTTLFNPKQEKYSRFSFVHVSNMVPLKNVEGIIDAFQKFYRQGNEDAQLILIGNRNDDHKAVASNLGLLNQAIFFRGEIPYADVAAEMQRCHCFILNSTMENSPCVIGEALCAGLPVIATEVGGVPELVDASNSILIPAGNPEALVTAMSGMRKRYSGFDLAGMAASAAERFGYSAVARQFGELYAGIGSRDYHSGHERLKGSA
ncbi:MAG: glycosyltransferase [Flavisolibacter sp.]